MRRGSTLFAMLAAAATAAVAQVPVASVNGVKISSEALDRRFDEHLRARNMNIARLQRPDRVREMKRAALDELIHEELLWQQAQRENRIASDEDVERALAQAIERAGSRERFLRSVARQGFDEAGYRRHVRRMLSADRAAQALVEQRVVVSDDEIESFYRANPPAFSQPERVRLREILIAVPPQADAAERARARARIDAIAAQLAAGADFADLARRHSQHPTRQWGGAHDPMARNEIAAPLRAAVLALQPGAISGVIESEAGFHLLRVEEWIAPTVVPLEAAREAIRRHLVDSRGREVLAREVAALRAASRIELLVPL
jgi:parvulin-like peptidyl-prolyl isomerase